MNILGFNSSSSNIFGQDLDSGSSPEFQSVKVDQVVLKGQDVNVENLEADDGVVFYDRAAKRAKLSTSDGIVSTTETLADLSDIDALGNGPFLSLAEGGFVASTVILNDGLTVNNGVISANSGINLTGSISNLRTDDQIIILGQGAGGGTETISIGLDAAYQNDQGSRAIAIGVAAGGENQGYRTVAIGSGAGQIEQKAQTVAVGDEAGFQYQDVAGVAVGWRAGRLTQGRSSIAIGSSAGATTQGPNSVALGPSAGATNQGPNCVALGSTAGTLNQAAESILINAADAVNLESTASNQIKMRAGTTLFEVDTASITHQGNSIAGDFKSDGTVPMTGNLIVSSINGLSPTGGKFSQTESSQIVHDVIDPLLFQSLIGNGIGSLTTVGGVFKVGTTGYIKIGGVLTIPTNNSTNFILRFLGGPTGTTELWSSSNLIATAIATQQYWEIELEFVIRALGSDPFLDNLGINGSFKYLSDNGAMTGESIVPSMPNTPIDTTIDNIFGVEMQLTTPGTSVTTHVASLSTLY